MSASFGACCGVLLFMASTALPAAESATPSPGDKPRELLQPPAREIPSPITDHFALRGSYLGQDVSTQVRRDSSTGVPGTEFDVEDEFGLDDRIDQGAIEMVIRTRPRHRLRVDYFKLTRHGDEVLTRDIDLGDDTYVAGDEVVSDLDWRMLNLTYYYSVVRLGDWLEVGAGLGVHLIEVRGSSAVPLRGLQQEFDQATPFPTFALDATWRFAQRFTLYARWQRFHGGIDEFDGSLGMYHVDVQYRWYPNLGIGFGLTGTRATFDSRDEEFPGSFRMRAGGIDAFVRVSF